MYRATMVTAILPSLTDGDDNDSSNPALARQKRNARHSAAYSVESELTITPERYTRTLSHDGSSPTRAEAPNKAGKASALAGYVGLFTGCGALVALALFLPLPAKFGEIEHVTPGEAVSYSFYVVAAVSLFVAVFVFVGLRHLKGEEEKGWRVLFGLKSQYDEDDVSEMEGTDQSQRQVSCLQFVVLPSALLTLTRRLCRISIS